VALINIKELKKLSIPLTGGLDEASPVDNVPLEDAIEMINWRLSEDGKRVEKRLGSADQSLTEAEDIYGYWTYYNATSPTPDFCQLLINESQIKRKVGSGSWTSIHSFSSNIAHPVRPLEIQGKQFIINEVDSRFIHTDGADYQIGIDAPTTVPTLTAGAGDNPAGVHRYAVKYVRSGNYSNESNPIKSLVGTASPTCSGIDDCEAGGTYTGKEDITCRVRIDGTGANDTIEISYDGGTTWHTTDMPITTTMYINYGIQLTFGVVTGHTSADYWDIACTAMAVTLTANQLCTLTSIPKSGDAQVDQRKIYRTVVNGSAYLWLATINDNTTESFVDNIPDTALGGVMTEDHDILPDGKFAIFWDDRLWVSGDNHVYYSDIDNPESFDTDVRYVKLKGGKSGDEITGMIEYKDRLYVFQRMTVFVIQRRLDGTYSRHLVNRDFGCVAPFSLIEAQNLLMFLSHKGWEVYNGVALYSLNCSVALRRTIATIDTSKYDYLCSGHLRARNEVWLSIPDVTGTTSNKALVYNYVRNKFYIFNFHKIISTINEVRNSSKATKLYYGTRDGYLLLGDSGYQDGGNNITATLWKPWMDMIKYADIRRFDVEYECPDNMTLTTKHYLNYDKDVQRTGSHTGVSPSATDIELRRPIKDFCELGLRGRWYTFELVNAENVGADLKVNSATVYVLPKIEKGKISGD